MKITKIELIKIEIPMKKPFTVSFGVIKKRPTVIVRVTTDEGYTGYGEGASLPFPDYKPEATDITYLVIHTYLSPLVLHKNFETIEEFVNLLSIVQGNTYAKTALENAVWMIFALKENKSLKTLLGGTKTEVPVGESVGIQPSIEETVAEVEKSLNEGYQRIKIKIKPGWDIKVVEKIRNKFNEIQLMVDGNSGYTLRDTHIFQTLDKFNLTMIEQPLDGDDIIDHATLQKQIKTALCLDESLNSKEDVRKALEINACRIVNIKPGRVGGLLEAKKIHDYCMDKGIGVWCGGMLETGLGRAYNLAIASLPNYLYPADMSPADVLFTDDILTDSISMDKRGFVKVPDQAGIGVEIDNKKLDRYTVDKIIME